MICSLDENRKIDFETVLKRLDDKYIMLGYPRAIDDLEKFNWLTMGYLTQDLQNVINSKNLEMLVTHNPDGEYGHKNHKITNQIVTSLVKDKSKFNKKILCFAKKFS